MAEFKCIVLHWCKFYHSVNISFYNFPCSTLHKLKDIWDALCVSFNKTCHFVWIHRQNLWSRHTHLISVSDVMKIEKMEIKNIYYEKSKSWQNAIISSEVGRGGEQFLRWLLDCESQIMVWIIYKVVYNWGLLPSLLLPELLHFAKM